MGLSLKELRKISNFCRKNGIINYKCADFELTFSGNALKLPKPKTEKVEIPIAGMHSQQLPDLTLWSSTPYMGASNNA